MRGGGKAAQLQYHSRMSGIYRPNFDRTIKVSLVKLKQECVTKINIVGSKDMTNFADISGPIQPEDAVLLEESGWVPKELEGSICAVELAVEGLKSHTELPFVLCSDSLVIASVSDGATSKFAIGSMLVAVEGKAAGSPENGRKLLRAALRKEQTRITVSVWRNDEGAVTSAAMGSSGLSGCCLVEEVVVTAGMRVGVNWGVDGWCTGVVQRRGRSGEEVTEVCDQRFKSSCICAWWVLFDDGDYYLIDLASEHWTTEIEGEVGAWARETDIQNGKKSTRRTNHKSPDECRMTSNQVAVSRGCEVSVCWGGDCWFRGEVLRQRRHGEKVLEIDDQAFRSGTKSAWWVLFEIGEEYLVDLDPCHMSLENENGEEAGTWCFVACH